MGGFIFILLLLFSGNAPWFVVLFTKCSADCIYSLYLQHLGFPGGLCANSVIGSGTA